jgi:hypothetical protein
VRIARVSLPVRSVLHFAFERKGIMNTTAQWAQAAAAVCQFDTLSPSVLVTLADASAVSGRSRASLYRHFKAGELTLVKVGHSTRIRVGELRRLIGAA